MKMISLLLAIAVLNGHFQKGKVDTTKVNQGSANREIQALLPAFFPYKPSCAYDCLYSGTEISHQTIRPDADEVASGLGLLHMVCSFVSCVLPLVEQETNGIHPADQVIPSAISGLKDYHFEMPGMLSVSIRE